MTDWRVALAVVAAVAAALRLPGVAYGLPAVYNPDEIAILNRALALGTGTLNPGNFVYPSFYFYVLVVWEGVSFLAGLAFGVFSSAADFQRAYFVDASWHYLAGRLLTVLCGVATVLLTARLGAILYSRTVGLLAGAFLAVAPFAVRDAHYIKHDVPVTVLVLLTLTAAARLVARPDLRLSSRHWIVAGGCAGLAASTHYYAVFAAVAVGAAALLGAPAERWTRRMRYAAIAGAAAVALFAAGSPFLFLDPARAWADITANRAIVMDRAVAAGGTFASLGRYAEMLVSDATGWTVFLLALPGAVLALRRDWRRAIIWLGFPLVFLAFLANTVPAGRYLNPVLPSMALAAAFAVHRASAVFSRPGPVAALLAVAAALPGLVDSVRVGQFFRQADTRTLAAEFIEREIPAGAGILVQPYSVALRPSRDSLIRALRARLGSETLASPRFKGQLALNPYPAPAYDLLWLGDGGLDQDKIYISPSAFVDERAGLEPLKVRGVEYVVLNQSRGTNAAFGPLEQALETEATLLGRFEPWTNGLQDERPSPFLHNTDRTIEAGLERPGPVVEIWRVAR